MRKKTLITTIFAILLMGVFVTLTIWPDAIAYITIASLTAVLATAFVFLVGAVITVFALNTREQIEQNMN